MSTLTIKDETATGGTIRAFELTMASEQVTLKDVIEARVLAEVEAYNRRLPDYFHGLVRPSEAEETLNGYKLKNRKAIDAEEQVYIALAAFQKNGYFVLVDDVQAEGLDDRVTITADTTVSFIKLTPLVGG